MFYRWHEFKLIAKDSAIRNMDVNKLVKELDDLKIEYRLFYYIGRPCTCTDLEIKYYGCDVLPIIKLLIWCNVRHKGEFTIDYV